MVYLKMEDNMGWKRANECLMCGKDRCLENKDEPGVGYCFRNNMMHRNGKPFIRKGVKPWNSERGGEKPKGKSLRDGQMEFEFD